MNRVFRDFDLSAVWQPKGYADKDYKEAPFTPEILAKVEAELGYTLPPSFTALMTVQNGGTFRNICFPTAQPNSWSETMLPLKKCRASALPKQAACAAAWGKNCGWKSGGYPPIGVYFANDPTAGHAMFALDYRQCGRNGEPKVVLVMQERNYEIIELAPDFETFIRNLRHENEFLD